MISIPSTQGPILADDTPETAAPWGTGLESGADRVATSPSFTWTLPVDEVAKMERLERGQTLRLSPTVERCLDRVAQADSNWDSSRFRLAFSPKRTHPPDDAEVAAMIAEVPLCLLSGRQRAQALALRRHGQGPSDAPAPDFQGQASRMDLTVACMEALNAARGDLTVSWTSALARLARWETEAPSAEDAQARASGGRALRQVVKDRTDVTLHLEGDGLSQGAREFSLPPRALLAELDLRSREFLADLGQARPLDLAAFRDSLAAIEPGYWDLRLNDDPEVSPALIPDYAVNVGLRGDAHRCAGLALALASRPERELQQVRIHLAEPASTEPLPQAPVGWRFHQSGTTWTLSRESPVPSASASAAAQTSSHSLRT